MLNNWVKDKWNKIKEKPQIKVSLMYGCAFNKNTECKIDVSQALVIKHQLYSKQGIKTGVNFMFLQTQP